MGLTLVTPPSAYPITRAEAIAQIKVDASPPDATYIDALIAAATEYSQNWCGGRRWIEQTWDYTLDCFPAVIVPPLAPVQSDAVTIAYVDADGVTRTLGSSLYQVSVREEKARIVPAYNEIWPVTRSQMDAVTVRLLVGYADDGGSPADWAANVPDAVKHAIKMLVAHFYEQRQPLMVGLPIASVPHAVEALLAGYLLPGT